MNVPSIDEMVGRIHDAARAAAFVREHYETLRRQYPDQHVALHAYEVVASGRDSLELMDNVAAAGFDFADVWSFFIPAEPMRLLL